MYKFSSIIFVAIGMFSNFQLFSQIKIQNLDFDKIDHAQISIEREIYGILRDKKKIWSLPKFGGFVIESRYNPDAKDSEEAFFMKGRDTANGRRHPLPEQISDSFWRGIVRIDQKLVIFDPFRRRFITYNLKEKEWGMPRDLVLDLLSPPADSRGLPPQRETNSYRARFLSSYKKVQSQPEIFTDATLLPESWRSRVGGAQILIASRVPGFSLIGIKCDLSGLGYCQFQQGCFVDSPIELDSSGLTGIAVSETRRQILVGDYRKQQIYIFRFDSCYHIKHVLTLQLPGQLKAITGLDVDKDDNLWVSTEEPDSYKNASVYRWVKQYW